MLLRKKQQKEHEMYSVVKFQDADEDSAWDADEWCWMVMQGDDILCICATQSEAEHITSLVNEKPYGATVTG